YLYWEFPEGRGQQAVRMDNWKGIRDSTKSGNMKIQLFDLARDIQENVDVAEQHADIVGRIEQIMEESHQKPEIDRFDIFGSR
ncbi:MAG: N-acetylgalactosamine-6-sulfatase, partial [Chloroflexota bacterium]